MIKGEALGKSLLGASLFFLLFGVVSHASPRSHFTDFLIFEDNAAGLVQISQTNPEAFAVLPEPALNDVFDFLFLKYQRQEPRTWVLNLYKGLMCPNSQAKARLCEYLSNLWKGPLLETFFWDASLVQLSRARELLSMTAKTPRLRREQCQEARSLLSELESKEGAFGPLLETQLQVFECLSDESARLDVYQKLETLRNIQSALGT
jgi:hypothetical protein